VRLGTAPIGPNILYFSYFLKKNMFKHLEALILVFDPKLVAIGHGVEATCLDVTNLNDKDVDVIAHLAS
jgi:hypothetical protein